MRQDSPSKRIIRPWWTGAVDDRGGHVGVAEDPAPSAELDVGGVDDALGLVRVGDDLEQGACCRPRRWARSRVRR